MRFVALAAGFDGTLARGGRVDERSIAALETLAASGRKLILVTARVLRELLEIFPEARIFDRIVAENGAVMHQPATRESEILAPAPSELLLQELERNEIEPLAVGSSIIATSASQAAAVREAIGKLRLDCRLVRNGDTLMILPAEVDKASGVREALRRLGVSPHNLVAIGDGQNDLSLFQLAEYAVAVRNADSYAKRIAQRTTSGEHCDGFLELARDLIDSDLSYAPPKVRVPLARRRGRTQATLAPYCDALLVCGPRASGKTALCNRLFEDLLGSGYQCCLIGTDAQQMPLAHPDVRLFGRAHEPPRLADIMAALEHPDRAVAVNVAGLAAESRPMFAAALLVQLQALHDRVGRPHSVFVYQADRLFADGVVPVSATRLSEMTMVYSSAEPERIPVEILGSVRSVVALGARARIPSQFHDFGETMMAQLDTRRPGGRNVAARIWARDRRELAGETVPHATAGGAVCGIAELREEV